MSVFAVTQLSGPVGFQLIGGDHSAMLPTLSHIKVIMKQFKVQSTQVEAKKAEKNVFSSIRNCFPSSVRR